MSKLKSKDQRRFVSLIGTLNFRDLGGYPTTDGKYTQWGKYFRSDSIDRLPLESQKALIQKGIGLIIDLRYPHEDPYSFYEELGIKYVNIPFLNPVKIKEEAPKSLLELYCNIIDKNQKSIYQVIQHFIAEKDKAVLFHCAAGKDRTGIFAALLLDLVGVSQQMIAENYALSATYLHPQLEERWRKLSVRYGIVDKAILDSEPETMLAFLQYINKKYKNTEGYLKEIGIENWEIKLLKKKFIGNETNGINTEV
ncbi:tyrosine-protein phosphatase [Oceanobacillus longus]|uniref:Tyrosine-protein phosphatase n=1 Tax=Oceanobacillus longus TaxID=930120 RepID=A0ABV8GX50_9BACI